MGIRSNALSKGDKEEKTPKYEHAYPKYEADPSYPKYTPVPINYETIKINILIPYSEIGDICDYESPRFDDEKSKAKAIEIAETKLEKYLGKLWENNTMIYETNDAYYASAYNVEIKLTQHNNGNTTTKTTNRNNQSC